jgi:hypothetical protein
VKAIEAFAIDAVVVPRSIVSGFVMLVLVTSGLAGHPVVNLMVAEATHFASNARSHGESSGSSTPCRRARSTPG